MVQGRTSTSGILFNGKNFNWFHSFKDANRYLYCLIDELKMKTVVFKYPDDLMMFNYGIHQKILLQNWTGDKCGILVNYCMWFTNGKHLFYVLLQEIYWNRFCSLPELHHPASKGQKKINAISNKGWKWILFSSGTSSELRW